MPTNLAPAPAAGEDLRARILLVDDHPPNLMALEAILAPLGEELVAAASGEDALRKLLQDDFAVILMDVQMPGLDGIETAALIKKRERNRLTPIIFLTAIHKDPSTIFRGYSQGAVDYLLKPFDAEILRTKVSVFVDLWKKGEQIRRQAALLRAQELLQLEWRSLLRFRAVLDSMPLCVWAARADGEIEYANRSWSEYAGPEGGRSFLEGVPAEEAGRVRDAWREAVRRGRPLKTELRLRRWDGQLRWHLFRAVPELDERGARIGWIATATDIDEQKRVEQSNAELLVREQEAREQAEVANRTKDDFLAMVSHELRTPLNAILGWARMLRSGAVEGQNLERALETIERNARLQMQLIEEILDVSRIIAGKLRVEPRRIDLHGVVQAAVDAVRPAAEGKGVELSQRIGQVSGDFFGDPARLQQVMWNLLANAIKFTPSGGKVAVELRGRDESLEIVVTDTGVGIAKEFLPHVFERFRQADSSLTREQGGLGLGLAIARHLVEAHGGSVQAESEGEGKGARFTVRLPFRDRPEAADAQAAAERGHSEQVSLAGKRVLVVEDEPDALELVTAVLGNSGAVVCTACNVDEALRVIEAEHPDVLVSDIGLPAEDGYALIRRVRALGSGGAMPALALSAYASVSDQRRAIEAGFNQHLSKPVEPSELVAQVASLASRAAAEPGTAEPPGAERALEKMR